ncbi:MAG TPA: hypothetical protein VFG69_21345 [Nannocystaceae bacterium]|nr:hypothetical protein [Nannocystaceae bacterium]
MDCAASSTRRALAKNLARALALSGRPRRHVAEVAGCPADVLFDILAGRVPIGLDRLDRLAAAVGWPAWSLLDDIDAPPPLARPAPHPVAGTEIPSVATLKCRTQSLLLAREWNVQMLVERTDLGKPQIHTILAGHSGTSVDAVARLAAAFEVAPKAMLVPHVGDRDDVA